MAMHSLKQKATAISQLNQVQYLQNIQEIFMGVSRDDSNEKTSKQTNQKTDKQFFRSTISLLSEV